MLFDESDTKRLKPRTTPNLPLSLSGLCVAFGLRRKFRMRIKSKREMTLYQIVHFFCNEKLLCIILPILIFNSICLHYISFYKILTFFFNDKLFCIILSMMFLFECLFSIQFFQITFRVFCFYFDVDFFVRVVVRKGVWKNESRKGEKKTKRTKVENKK